MRRICKMVAAALVIQLLSALPLCGLAADTDMPDMEGVKAGDYLLDSNEDGGESFISWGSDPAQISAQRIEENRGDGSKVRRLMNDKANAYIRNFLLDETGTVSGEKIPVNYRKYRYFSFWYRGDGTENTLTVKFKKDSAADAAAVTVAIPADTTWRYYSKPVSEILVSGRTLEVLESFNIALSAKGASVYLDDILLSGLNPLDPGKVDPPESTETAAPTDAPGGSIWQADGQYGRYMVLEDNEGISRVTWKGDSAATVGSVPVTALEEPPAGEAAAALGANVTKFHADTGRNYTKNSAVAQAVRTELTENSDAYHYLSFWYRGAENAKGKTFKFLFCSTTSANVTGTVQEIPLTDTQWHLYTVPIDSWKANLGKLNYVGLAMGQTATCDVYLDKIIFSERDPLTEPPVLEPFGFAITDFAIAQAGVPVPNGVLSQGTYQIAGSIVNLSGTQKNGVLVLAAYGPENRMGQVRMVYMDLPGADTGQKDFSETLELTGAGPYLVKATIWENMEWMEPLTRFAQ